MTNQNISPKKGYIEDSFDLFDYKNLGQVRTVVDNNNEKWFCLKDLCVILGIKNPWDVAKRISEPYLDTIEVWVNTGFKADGTPAERLTPTNFVNLAGLFQAVGESRKPEAKELINWLYGTVVPELDRKGYYVMNNKPMEEVINDLRTEMRNYADEEVAIMKNALDEVIAEHNRFVLMYKKKYDSISGYAHSNNYPLTLDMAKDIAIKASKLAKDMGMETGSIPHKKWGQVRSYPNAVLDIIFQDYFNEFLNDYSTNKDELEKY